MATRHPEALQKWINWEFTLSEQDLTTRWGTFAGTFWKQFLPGGVPIASIHPPRKVPKRLFEIARDRAT